MSRIIEHGNWHRKPHAGLPAAVRVANERAREYTGAEKQSAPAEGHSPRSPRPAGPPAPAALMAGDLDWSCGCSVAVELG